MLIRILSNLKVCQIIGTFGLHFNDLKPMPFFIMSYTGLMGACRGVGCQNESELFFRFVLFCGVESFCTLCKHFSHMFKDGLLLHPSLDSLLCTCGLSTVWVFHAKSFSCLIDHVVYSDEYT
jgi:hypothetical protein